MFGNWTTKVKRLYHNSYIINQRNQSDTCEDIDECAQKICGSKKCTNTPGSFKCQGDVASYTYKATDFSGKKIISGNHYYAVMGEKLMQTHKIYSNDQNDCGKYAGTKVSSNYPTDSKFRLSLKRKNRTLQSLILGTLTDGNQRSSNFCPN